MEFYKMTIAGLERELPICALNEHLDIAGFIMFGDVEITVASAKALLEKCPEFDYIVTPEAKSIPLAYEMSRQSGKKYFVLRKKEKAYMVDPVKVEVQSISTKGVQTLVLDSLEGKQLENKRVLVVDDVISTGESLKSVEKMLQNFNAAIVGKAAVLAEGDAADRDDIIFLEKLPLFFK